MYNSTIVIGAAGFVGSNLTHKLNELNYDYIGIDSLKFSYRENLPEGANFIHKDLKNIDDRLLNSYDTMVAVHCSNIIYAMEYPIDTIVNNAINTISMMQKFKGKIVYTSTASVYGDADIIPTPEDAEKKFSNPYDTSKFIVEQYLEARGNYTTLRLSNVYGRFQRPDHPYSGVIGKFIGQQINNTPITIYGDGGQTRDYTYVDDVVDAVLRCVELPAQNTEINIASGVETSVIEVAQSIRNILRKQIKYNYLPNRSIDTISRRCLDVSKAKSLLNWSSQTDLKEGLAKTISWYESTIARVDTVADRFG